MPTYEQGMAEKQLYSTNQVFESYFHSLNMISMDYFPLFYSRKSREHLHAYYMNRLEILETKHPKLIPKVKKFMHSKGPIKTDDLKQFGKPAAGDTKWRANSFAANILEVLWALGEIKVVERDENFRKYYDFIEKHVEPAQLNSPGESTRPIFFPFPCSSCRIRPEDGP